MPRTNSDFFFSVSGAHPNGPSFNLKTLLFGCIYAALRLGTLGGFLIDEMDDSLLFSSLSFLPSFPFEMEFVHKSHIRVCCVKNCARPATRPTPHGYVGELLQFNQRLVHCESHLHRVYLETKVGSILHNLLTYLISLIPPAGA